MIRRPAEISAFFLLGLLLPLAASAVDADRPGSEPCRKDRDCSGYNHCLDQVCSVPPAVHGLSDAQTPVVEFVRGETSLGRFFVELANDPYERGRGLSHRPGMAEGWGMLFVFPETVRNPFTMALMHFPLDMIFLDESGRVVDVIEGAAPPGKRFLASAGFQFVLELNAGAARTHEIAVGDQMQLTGPRPPFLPIGQ